MFGPTLKDCGHKINIRCQTSPDRLCALMCPLYLSPHLGEILGQLWILSDLASREDFEALTCLAILLSRRSHEANIAHLCRKRAKWSTHTHKSTALGLAQPHCLSSAPQRQPAYYLRLATRVGAAGEVDSHALGQLQLTVQLLHHLGEQESKHTHTVSQQVVLIGLACFFDQAGPVGGIGVGG